MKDLRFTILTLALAAFLFSCEGRSDHAQTAEGFTEIENEIKKIFGGNAYFTDINISYIESIGNVISVTVTSNPESLRMGQWNQSQGVWKKESEISLEVPEGTKAADYMYQLGDKINLAKLGELIEKSKMRLESEKSLKNSILTMAFVNFPDTGDYSKAEYVVRLEPKTGGASFTFSYKLDGELIKMDS
jgi:hypothetical protein